MAVFCLQQLVLHGHVDEGHEAIGEVDEFDGRTAEDARSFVGNAAEGRR